MARKALSIVLSEEERTELERIVRKRTAEHRLVIRAEIVLLASRGLENKKIAKLLHIETDTVCLWRKRFAFQGLAGLRDIKKPGRPRIYTSEDKLKVITTSCQKPETTTHWTLRDLAQEINKQSKKKMSHMTIQRILKSTDLKPHQYEMWCNSQDPDFETKQIDVVGLYLNPPQNAIVLSVDEKTGIQALERKYHRPMIPGYPERVEHEYVRHGTKSLIAAFTVHKGEVLGKCYDRRRHQEFLDFLNEIEKAYPKVELHIIVDNLNIHKHPKVKKWLKKRNGRIKFHFTPTHASWLNQIEIWFSLLSRYALRGASFTSVRQLRQAIDDFISVHNEKAAPFEWTKRYVRSVHPKHKYAYLYK